MYFGVISLPGWRTMSTILFSFYLESPMFPSLAAVQWPTRVLPAKETSVGKQTTEPAGEG